jgi:hypothetical protein
MPDPIRRTPIPQYDDWVAAVEYPGTPPTEMTIGEEHYTWDPDRGSPYRPHGEPGTYVRTGSRWPPAPASATGPKLPRLRPPIMSPFHGENTLEGMRETFTGPFFPIPFLIDRLFSGGNPNSGLPPGRVPRERRSPLTEALMGKE